MLIKGAIEDYLAERKQKREHKREKQLRETRKELEEARQQIARLERELEQRAGTHRDAP